jgi:MFS family permease
MRAQRRLRARLASPSERTLAAGASSSSISIASATGSYGRRAIVLPFVALSPVATLLLILAPRDLAVIAASRALAGLCSGAVFGSATAWVQELSRGSQSEGKGVRRAALALTAGFGLGPVVAAMLAQWAGDPLQVPYLPHLVIGVAAAALLLRTPETGAVASTGHGWPPAAVRTWSFWLGVAPASPLVFGSVALALVVLPEEVTRASTLSAGFAGLMTALTFAAGIAVQPLARRVPAACASIAGLCCAAAGTGLGAVAVHDADRVLAGVCAVLLGLAYGLCLVSGLRQVERLADVHERGAVAACFYVLAYVGFAAPYLVAGLGAAAGRTGALAVLAVTALALAVWTATPTSGAGRAPTAGSRGPSVKRRCSVKWHRGRYNRDMTELAPRAARDAAMGSGPLICPPFVGLHKEGDPCRAIPFHRRVCKDPAVGNLDELNIPKAMRPVAEEIIEITDAVCADLLDAEYAELARQAVAKLARKRPSPLASGRRGTWAGAVVYAIGQVNFLFDASQQPHCTPDQLSAAFGVSKGTMSSKAKQVRDLLKMEVFSPAFQRASMLEQNSMLWFIQVDGLVVDARSVPIDLQADAYRQGLIPYIHALGVEGTAEFDERVRYLSRRSRLHRPATGYLSSDHFGVDLCPMTDISQTGSLAYRSGEIRTPARARNRGG